MSKADGEVEPLLPKSDREPEGSLPWLRSNWFLLLVCSANYFKWTLLYVAFIPVLPFYAKTFGLNGWEQSLLVAALQVGWLIAFPILHHVPLASRHFLYLGGVAYAISPMLLGFASEVWMLFLARIMEGFGSCLLMNTCDAILARQTTSSMRGRAFGMQKAFGMTALLYGPLSSGWLLDAGGLMLIMGIVSVVGWLSIGLYYVAPEAWFEARDENVKIESVQRFRHILGNSHVAALMILQFFAFAMTGVFWVAMPQYLEGSLNTSAFTLSCCWLGWDAFKLVCSLLGGWLSDFTNSWAVMTLGLCTMGVASVALGVVAAFQPGLPQTVLLAAFMAGMGGSGGGLVGPAFSKLLMEMEKRIGKCMYEEMLTVSFVTITIAILMGNIYAGFVVHHLGFELTFISFGLAELVVLGLCAWVTRQLMHLNETATQ